VQPHSSNSSISDAEPGTDVIASEKKVAFDLVWVDLLVNVLYGK
jgi:hypothetical protein